MQPRIRWIKQIFKKNINLWKSVKSVVTYLEIMDFFFIEIICMNPAPQRGARMNTKGGAG